MELQARTLRLGGSDNSVIHDAIIPAFERAGLFSR